MLRAQRERRGRPLAVAVAAAAVMLASGWGVAAARTSRPLAAPSGTATFAEIPGAPPNYIFPLSPIQYFNINNFDQFQYLMFRPLYWFGVGAKPVLNESLSLADLPIYSDGGRVVTITLKPYRWSNGDPVTSRDVEFWMNLVTANKADWAGYVPGDYPDNVRAFRVLSPTRFSMTLTRPFGSFWFTYNELSQLTPIPQRAWDKTSTTAPIGNYDMTAKGAVAVYTYLAKQASQLATYATNPLWQVVDGPWHLTQFNTLGNVEFAPNPDYSGPVRPRLAHIVEVPFTNDTAEFNAVRAGELTYGYLPTQDISQIPYLRRRGYQVVPWIAWEISYFLTNYTNPTAAPILKQLYIRQAMESLIDQPAYVRDIYKGYGYANYGPVPIKPQSPYVTPLERDGAYPYNPAHARALLRAHGWTVHPNGVTSCARPGAGSGLCGAGIASGAGLQFPLYYYAGVVAEAQVMEAMKSSFSYAGIDLMLKGVPGNELTTEEVPCDKKTGTGCSWVFTDPGYWYFAPDYYPTGGEIYGCGSGSNPGGYCNPTNQSNIARSHASNSLQALYSYENFLTLNLPTLFVPVPDNTISVISDHLHGAVPQNPLTTILPENWTLSG